MAKAVSEKKYITFVKGLITEANALTFPENASLDEDNFDLHINGSRSRRLGVDYEDGYALTATGIAQAVLTGTRKAFYRWDFPGGDTTVSIGVVRAYNKLWFINLLDPVPSTALLNNDLPITISGLDNSELSVASINNYLVLVSNALDTPILLTYTASTQLISQEILPIQVRDTWGIEDGKAIDERPLGTDFDERHFYNLYNQGWIDTISADIPSQPILGEGHVISNMLSRYWKLVGNVWVEETPVVGPSWPPVLFAMYINLNVFPSNADIWTLGKDGSSTSGTYQEFVPEEMVKNTINNMSAPRGRHIIDAFNRGVSRRALTGLSTLLNDSEGGRPTTVTAYAGRLFYAGVSSSVSGKDGLSPNYSGTVFFSQIADNKDKLGKCYQEADPTSPDISDIVETDGGIIVFPEISRIIKLIVVKDSLIVFADNGIWEIYSDTGGFTATSFQVSKISTTGITNGNAVVVSGASVVYWAKAGIFSMEPNPQTGRFETQNISLGTIQTFYTSIPDIAKANAKGLFSEKSNHIHWMYNDGASYSTSNNINHYNKILNLDLSLKAFYKYSISPAPGTSPMVADFIDIPSNAIETNIVDVYVGNDQVLAVADDVQITDTISRERDSKYSFLTFTGTSFTISKFRNTSFVDWETFDAVGVDYSSYLITGYETFGDVTRAKQVPYIWFYLNRTETGFESSGGGLVPLNPSSCLVQAQWNWSNSDAQGKWGTQFQVYRYLKTYIPSGIGDIYDTGDSIIVTKNKFRGSGKALSLKINSEAGKDLQLLGWALIVTGDGTP